ncbi:MAG TPA: alcohol dehydrogenase [Lachnospiraceae bacterium]|nr:SDR family oxidoreductase [uncultured Lachnoclostridium sp.]HAU84762.1 alcohol dehydrogenase [Lachnospiraceae bacterium]
MKTVVITGSTRGFGYEMAKMFLLQKCNVVISGRKQATVEETCEKLRNETQNTSVKGFSCNVTDINALEKLWNFAKSEFQKVDIWINNAGVNQPDRFIWEIGKPDIDHLIDIDLKGTVYGSKVAMNGMIQQGFGFIYNVEGHGSNDNIISKLSLYGTTKRAVTYFTQALAKEAEESKSGVKVGRIAPGIMITDFLRKPLGGDKNEITLDNKTVKVYNILGDYPETIARYVVRKMLVNTKNDVRIVWLTNRRAAGRFLKGIVKKRKLIIE